MIFCSKFSLENKIAARSWPKGVPKPSLAEFSVIDSNLVLARKNAVFFCSFLGIPCNNRTFKCGNDICFRKQNAKCDGTVDCPDGSDEEGCSE